MDPTHRRISGDIGNLSKQKSPVASDLAVSKDATVSCLNIIRKSILCVCIYGYMYIPLSAQSHNLVCTILLMSLACNYILLSALISCI